MLSDAEYEALDLQAAFYNGPDIDISESDSNYNLEPEDRILHDWNDVVKRLQFANELISNHNQSVIEEGGDDVVDMYLFWLFGGSCCLYHLRDEFRMSRDIDYRIYGVVDTDVDVLVRQILEGYEVNDMGGCQEFPPIGEARSVDVIELSNLMVFIPSIEHLIITKLMTDREKDYLDLICYPLIDYADENKFWDALEELASFNYNKAVSNEYHLRKIKHIIEYRNEHRRSSYCNYAFSILGDDIDEELDKFLSDRQWDEC